MKRKIIFSCDTGIDDALALAYLAAQDKCQVIGVTVSYGMGKVENTFRNTKYILKLLGREDIPVIMGSEAPLSGIVPDYSGGSRFHGMDGIGNVLGEAKPEEFGNARPGQAVDFILEMIRKYKKDLVWVTSGPLTEIARVWEKDPETASQVGAVYVMGGSLAAPGNAGDYRSAVGEANVLLDVPAAAKVLDSSLPVVLVGLDVTRKTLLRYEDHERLKAIGTKRSLFFYEALKHYLDAYRQFHPYLDGSGLHDPLAAAAAVHPELLTVVPMHMMCVTEGPWTGRTMENVLRCKDREYPMGAALFVDVPAFEKEFFGKVEELLARS